MSRRIDLQIFTDLYIQGQAAIRLLNTEFSEAIFSHETSASNGRHPKIFDSS